MNVFSRFTPLHRGGSGSPLVCLHGFTDTWRTWELVLPVLERHHDVLAPTLPGHAGGPLLASDAGIADVADAVERLMDEAELATAHIVGNSLGGYVALHLAARGRAKSVVVLSPAGGWADVLWGTEDRLLKWPSAATRFRDDWLPQADWVVLEGVGHCPQLDIPLEAAHLIVGFTATRSAPSPFPLARFAGAAGGP